MILSSGEVKKIKKIKGQVRGVALKTDLAYVKDNRGKEAVKQVKKAVQEIDPEFDFGQIKNMEWYSLKWRALLLLVIKESFDWQDRDLYEMGRHAPTNSFVVKILLRYFYNFEKTCREAPSYWGKHYNKGKLELVEFSDDKKRVIYRLKNFNLHPVMCPYLKGYFQGIAELTKPGYELETRETKCAFKKARYHEFVITWK